MPLTDIQGKTALHYAALYGFPKVARLLLAHPGTSVNATDHLGATALIFAAQRGRQTILKLLADDGAQLDHKDSRGGPAILRAVDFDHLDCVRILQQRGADCFFDDMHGRNILHGCAINVRDTILRFLLQTLESLKPNAQDNKGQTPLHDAASRDHDRCARVLLDFGARTEIINNGGQSPVRTARDSDSTRCLSLLELARQSEMEKEGREQHVDQTRADTFGPDYEMPIHSAVMSLDNEALQSYLEKLGPKTDALIASRNIEDSQNPLHVAALRGKVHAVTWLLDHGAAIDVQDLWDGTPLIRAVQYSQGDVVQLLLDRGASLDLRDKLDRTALDFANDRYFDPKIASILIKKGAKMEDQPGFMTDCLDWVCEYGDVELVKCLVNTASLYS